MSTSPDSRAVYINSELAEPSSEDLQLPGSFVSKVKKCFSFEEEGKKLYVVFNWVVNSGLPAYEVTERLSYMFSEHIDLMKDFVGFLLPHERPESLPSFGILGPTVQAKNSGHHDTLKEMTQVDLLHNGRVPLSKSNNIQNNFAKKQSSTSPRSQYLNIDCVVDSVSLSNNLPPSTVPIHENSVLENSPGHDVGQVDLAYTESNLEKEGNLKSKSRTKISEKDLSTLRKYFKDSSPNPKFRECIGLSYTTNLDARQIQTFFMNERSRKRKNGNTEGIIFQERKRHSDSQITALEAWVATNESNDPRPTTKEKKELALKTELSLNQVADWFMNLRKKMKAEERG